MILLIDNYDSFSYNLYQLIGEINTDIKVIRNNEMTIEKIEKINPDTIVISPGPGKPSESGICEDVIKYFAGKKPILGICLGHQAICEVFGAKITYAKEIMHGKTSIVNIDNSCSIFKNLPEKIKVARYHSLAAEPSSMPECLVMAVKHRDYDIFGLQFHPESILTPDGRIILQNFFR